jgi:hypothetical protein
MLNGDGVASLLYTLSVVAVPSMDLQHALKSALVTLVGNVSVSFAVTLTEEPAATLLG